MTDRKPAATIETPTISPLDSTHVETIEQAGGKILPIDPIGAEVHGIDLSSERPPSPDVIEALESEMASRGFIDNLAVAHRAAPQAHLPAGEQGLRIMHRSTVRGVSDLQPHFGLPIRIDIYGPSPFGDGVWQSGGIGFRWDESIPMQN